MYKCSVQPLQVCSNLKIQDSPQFKQDFECLNYTYDLHIKYMLQQTPILHPP